jgi:hypothetical protein
MKSTTRQTQNKTEGSRPTSKPSYKDIAGQPQNNPGPPPGVSAPVASHPPRKPNPAAVALGPPPGVTTTSNNSSPLVPPSTTTPSPTTVGNASQAAIQQIHSFIQGKATIFLFLLVFFSFYR